MTIENRIIRRAPDEELQRRWDAVRALMDTAGVDVLIAQNNNDWLGGYVRWLTDVPATNGYPRTVIFPRHGKMTVIEMGSFGGERTFGDTERLHRGVAKQLTTPSFSAINYTSTYDADLAIAAIGRVENVGWVGPGALPFAFVEHIRHGLGETCKHHDVTDALDRIKAVKSPYEIALIRETATLQDQVFDKILNFIAPGMRDIDVTAYGQEQALILGSEQGIFLGASQPMGTLSAFMPRWAQGRTLQHGDHLSLLIEVNGPGGFYGEIARTIVLGKASDTLKQGFQAVKDAQDHSLSLLKPGVLAANVAAAHDAYMTARGLPPEVRLYCHGQGYDMVERPLVRSDETMEIAKDMCLAVHPGFETPEIFAVICDNYMIEADGPGTCLHKTEKRIFEI